MLTVCPECEYARIEREGIHEFDGGASRERARALAATERCAEHQALVEVLEAVPVPLPPERRALRIAVYNLEAGKPGGICEYIGRPRTLGNPYVIGRDGPREEVIALYKRWLWREMKAGGKVLAKMRDLLATAQSAQGLQLICHCKPLPCHGDVIADALRWLDGGGKL